MKEFIKLLRAAYPQQALMEQAANVIESQSMQIAELEEKYFEDHHCQCGHDDVCEFARERDALRAELSTIQKQDPIGYLYRSTNYHGSRIGLHSEYQEFGVPCYLAAGAKP